MKGAKYPGPSQPPAHLGGRSSLNLQVQLAIHVSQGITGHAGYQLPGTRDPWPTYFFPFHGGVGLDFTEKMGKREIGRFCFTVDSILPASGSREDPCLATFYLGGQWLED